MPMFTETPLTERSTNVILPASHPQGRVSLTVKAARHGLHVCAGSGAKHKFDSHHDAASLAVVHVRDGRDPAVLVEQVRAQSGE